MNSIGNMSNIYLKREGKRKRISSYDRSGGNDDRYHIKPNETKEFAKIDSSGIITHIWITLMNDGDQDKDVLRKTVIRMYWDNEESPSVEVPIGDFFGIGHSVSKNYVSAPLQMSPEDGKAFNCWWPMPFKKGAKLTVTNECDNDLLFYFYVDYEEKKIEDDALYFHAKWHRECPTSGKTEAECGSHFNWCFGGENKDYKDNYVVLDAKGKGHYCGCNLNIHNLSKSGLWNWPGEGDDMIFIDGDKEPTLYGTGTEDYFNTAWCPQQEHHAPYHGITMGGDDNWKGKISYYRYHIQDPIMFEKDIKVTIEHGHNNNRNDDWSTTAYWYQTEPHVKFEPLLEKEKRMPFEDLKVKWDDIKDFKLK